MRLVVCRERFADCAPKDFGGNEESLYAKWSRTCWRRQFDLRELHRALGYAPLRRSLLSAAFMDGKRGTLDEYAPVCAMLGLSSTAFYHAIGHDVFGRGVRAGVTTTLLRYCPRCMAHGYHATLFQHLAMSVCPVHDVSLVSWCTKCRRTIEPTWESTVQHPFACSYCGHLLVRTVPDPGRDDEVRLVDLMLGERRRILGQQRKTSFDVSEEEARGWPGGPKESEARLRRHIHRHLAWPPIAYQDGWITFKHVELRLRRETTHIDGAEKSAAVSRTIGATIVKLRALCCDQQPTIFRLAEKMDTNESGVRLESVAGAAAAAFCKTAYLYGVSPIHCMVDEPANASTRQLTTTDRRLVQRGDEFCHSMAANCALVEYEVIGMFCVILKRIAMFKKLVSVDWRESPFPSEFCPAWCFDPDPQMPMLLIRPRANWLLVNRLIRRYSNRVLL